MAARKPQRRREFGTVRKLASGRWQARYLGPDGQRHKAPETFETKSDAQDWLNLVRMDIERSTWRDPDAGAVNFEKYSLRWLEKRGLAPTTVDRYHRTAPPPHPADVRRQGPGRDHPALRPHMASRASEGDRRHHGRQVVPPAEVHPSDRGRRRPPPQQPMPHQGRRQGGGRRTSHRHHRAGLQPRRRHGTTLAPDGPARRLHLPPPGGTGRTTPSGGDSCFARPCRRRAPASACKPWRTTATTTSTRPSTSLTPVFNSTGRLLSLMVHGCLAAGHPWAVGTLHTGRSAYGVRRGHQPRRGRDRAAVTRRSLNGQFRELLVRGGVAPVGEAP